MSDEKEAKRARIQARVAEERRVALAGAGRVRLEEVCTGLPVEGVRHLGLDHSGHLVMAVSDTSPGEYLDHRNELLDRGTLDQVAELRYPVRLSVWTDEGPTVPVEVELTWPWSNVEPLDGGGYLVVTGGGGYSDGAFGRNALIVDRHGAITDRFSVGAVIAQTQVTPAGKVWVGYSEEEIFGGSMGEPPPLGRSGLVRWSLDGTREYEFDADAARSRSGERLVNTHSYALNLIDEDAWFYYYGDYPVVRIGADGVLTVWETGVVGARAIAVSPTGRIGFVGGHWVRDRLVVASLGDGECVGARTLQLLTPEGENMPSSSAIFARGSSIHAVTDGRWLRLELDDIDL